MATARHCIRSKQQVDCVFSLLWRPWTLNLSPGRPEYTCSAPVQLSKWLVDLMSGMTWISPGAYVWMAVTTRVSYMEHCFLQQWNTWRELVSKQLSCAHVWLCNHNSELATLHCENTGPGKIWQIFIISRGPILVKCPPVSDSLSAGSTSGDNSDMNTWFNQMCISLVTKRWYIITTVKTYLHFILDMDWKWMSLEIQRYKRILTPSATGHPARCWCTVVERHQWPLLLTWFNFNPSMDK